MADSIANLLLRVAGESSDAEATMAAMAAGLRALGAVEAEPEVNLEGDEATMASIVALMAAVQALDDQEAEVEVKVDKDGTARKGLAGLLDGFKNLFSASDETSKGLGPIGARFLGFSFQVNKLTGVLLALGYVAAGSVVVALAAMVASATMAAGAVGALAIALGGALLPLIPLAIAGVARFKAMSDQAGTAANALKTAVEKLSDVFTKSLGPAVDIIFGALADAITSIIPIVKQLGGPFEALARNMATAITIVARGFASISKELGLLIRISGPVWVAMAGLVRPFAEILINIARATMPFLIDILNRAGAALRGWAAGTRNITDLRNAIGIMVGHLESWWDLTKAIAGLFLSFVKSAASSGKGIVDWLTQGANALKKWMDSEAGRERIQEFFEDVLPAAKSVIGFLLRIARLLLQLIQVGAPAVKSLADTFNFLLDIISWVIEQLMDLLQWVVLIASWFIGPFSGGAKLATKLFEFLGRAARSVGAIIQSVGRFFQGAVGTIGGAARAIWAAVSRVWTDLILSGNRVANAIANFVWDVRQFWEDLANAAGRIFIGITNTIKGAVERVIQVIVNLWRGAADGVKGIWEKVRDNAASIWNRVRDAIRDQIMRARDAVVNFAGNIRERARAAWDNVLGGARNVWGNIRDAIRNAIMSARDAVVNFAGAIRERARAAWDAALTGARTVWGNIREAIRNAIMSARDAVVNFAGNIREAAREAWDKALTGARTVWGNIKDAIRNVVQDLPGVVRSIAGAMYSAGKAIIQSLINGIRSTIGAAVEEVRKGVAKIKDLLPGSEPKDPSSPLRGLQDSGAAIMSNMMAGIKKASPLLAQTLSAELQRMPVVNLSPLTPGVPTSTDLSRTVHYAPTFNVPPGPGVSGGYDPMYAASQLDGLLRNQGVLGR